MKNSYLKLVLKKIDKIIKSYLEVILYQHILYKLDMDKKGVLFPKDKATFGMFLPRCSVTDSKHLQYLSNVANGKMNRRLLPNPLFLKHALGVILMVLFLINTAKKEIINNL